MSEPAGIERDRPLARLTTVRTGGAAEAFARPRTEAELVELLAWAAAEGLAVEVVGSGSNLLIADAGVRGLVLKLDGELAALERDGTMLRCGGGVRLPSAAAKAAGWGLTGLEFGINIPGTVGGAVRMNANAYGGQLAAVLEWVDICTADGLRAPNAGRARVRLQALGATQRGGGGARLVRARRRRPGRRQGDARRNARQAPRGAAIRDQDLRLHLQEPGPRRAGVEGRTAGLLLAEAGAQEIADRRCSPLAQARQLRREHGLGDDRRRARGDGGGAPPSS